MLGTICYSGESQSNQGALHICCFYSKLQLFLVYVSIYMFGDFYVLLLQVTDLGSAHPMWFNKRVDLCFVPSRVRQCLSFLHLDLVFNFWTYRIFFLLFYGSSLNVVHFLRYCGMKH